MDKTGRGEEGGLVGEEMNKTARGGEDRPVREEMD